MSLIFAQVNTSITFFTMIALSNEAVIRWQPFGVSFLLGVTGAELNMCDVLFPSRWRSCWGSAAFHALFGRWHVVGALYVGILCLLRTGEILTHKAGQTTLSVDSGVALLA